MSTVPISEFTSIVRTELRKGFSISPFLGSGASAQSGIMMGQEFDDYLAHCVVKVLGRDSSKINLDISKQGWPERPSSSVAAENLDIIKSIFEEICDRVNKNRNQAESPGNTVDFRIPLVPRILRAHYSTFLPNSAVLYASSQQNPTDPVAPVLNAISSEWLSCSSAAYVEEMAIRHLFDWRATLTFLAKARVIPELYSQNMQTRIRIGEFNDSIIDGFNTHIVSGQKPNLCHKMVAHLSRPFRTRTFLTTNFDELLEEALDQVRLPYHVLDVRTGGQIPAPSTARSMNSIIKLHGTKVETRADLTLDSPPTQTDFEYLSKIILGRHHSSYDRYPHLPSHLFVVGYSGYDRRCVLLIKHLLDHDKEFKVFWVCYSDADVKWVSELFKDEISFERKSVILVQTPRPDLLMFELYQELTFGLPTGGFSYEYDHKIPPLPSSKTDHRIGESELTFIEQIQTHCINHTSPTSSVPGHSVSFGAYSFDRYSDLDNVIEVHVESGAIEIAGALFKNLRDQRKICLWFELQDHSSVGRLSEDFLRTLALGRGFHQKESFQYNPYPFSTKSYEQIHQHYKQLLSHMGYLSKDTRNNQTDIILFLYGRNLPGACAGTIEEPWDKKDYRELEIFLKVLCDCSVSVVYFPYSEFRHEDASRKLSATTATLPGTTNSIDGGIVRVLEQLGSICKSNAIDLEASERQWLNDWGKLQRMDEAGLYQASCEAVDKRVNGLLKTSTRTGVSRFEDRIQNTVYRLLESLAGNENANDFPNPNVFAKNGRDDSEARHKELISRLFFLYSITLFRQSRHLNAFLTEAVFRCPFRFNAGGTLVNMLTFSKDQVKLIEKFSTIPLTVLSHDNDLIRRTAIEQRVGILREEGVFLSKPASACWMYRDTRVRLRKACQQVERLLISSKSKSESEYFLCLAQARSRTHRWIGEWYKHAFYATGHSTPAIESLFHFLEGVKHAAYSGLRTSLADYTDAAERLENARLRRFQLVVVSSFEFRKLLSLSYPWLNYWINKPDLPSACFGIDRHSRDDSQTLADRIVEPAKKFWTEFSDNKSELYNNKLTGLARKVLGDLGGDICRYIDQCRDGKNVSFRFDPDRFVDADLVIGLRDISHCSSTEAVDSSAFYDKRRGFGNVKLDLKTIPFISEKADDVELTEMIDGLISLISAIASNWLGTDGTVLSQEITKSYEKEADSFLPMLAFRLYAHKGRLRRGDSTSVLVARFIVLAAGILSEVAYAFLKRTKLEILSSPGDSWDDPDEYKGEITWLSPTSKENLLKVCVFCRLSIDACSLIPPELIEAEIDLRLKSKAIYGTALGYLRRYYEAHRHLNEAMALFSKAEHVASPSHLAIIHLRRGEIYLSLAKQLAREVNRAHDLAKNAKFSKEGKLNFRTCYQQFCSSLDDAVACLENASCVFNSPEAARWRGRYLTLLIRCYSVTPSKVSCDTATDFGFAFQTLLFRRQIEHGGFVRSLFTQLLNVTASDTFRRIRAIDNFACAIRSLYFDLQLTSFVDMQQDLETVIKELILIHKDPIHTKSLKRDSLRSAYLDRVNEEVAKRLYLDLSKHAKKFNLPLSQSLVDSAKGWA